MLFSAMISATRSIPSPASTKTRGRVISSSRRTMAGSRPAATTFARMSHSVTIPMGRPSGDVTMTNPWRRSAIDFAAPRRVVSGRIERNSGSRMSFANRTIGGGSASAAFMPLLAGNRLRASPARDGRRDGPDQANRRDDGENLVERIHEGADFELSLGYWKPGEDRLHDGQRHPRRHDRERQAEAHQESDVEERGRHARGDSATYDGHGVHDRGHVRGDEQTTS